MLTKQNNAIGWIVIYLAPVVRKVDNAIHRMNHYPVGIAWFVLLTLIRWKAIYLLDSIIQPLNNWGLVDSVIYLSNLGLSP